MAKTFLTGINLSATGAYVDLNQNEIRNAVVQNLATAPGTPSAGQIYYDTALGRMRVRNASSWVELDPSWLLGQANTWTANQTVNASILGNGTIALTGTGSSSVAGSFQAVSFAATGLTGATSASRYAGATTTGAPTTGTFAVGDFVISQAGAIYVCTVAGNPGTWAQIGALPSIYYQTVKANNGTAVTQRSVINFVDGTFTTATATDNSSQTDVKFDVSTGTPTGTGTFGQANSAGTASTLARSDHSHSLPAHDATAHSSIKLSDLAAPAANVSWGTSYKIINLANPSDAQDAATKAYVDSVASGLTDFKQSVRAASTTNVALATEAENGASLGGVTLATGDRILLAGQSTAAENGIYTVNASGAPTRATDADASSEISVGTLVYVESGTNGSTQFICSAVGATPWTTATSSTWVVYQTVASNEAGAGLAESGGVLSVGAGTGITVNANDVAVNTSVVARWKTFTTSAATTTWTVNHALGNQFVTAQLFDASNNLIEADLTLTDANNCTFGFASSQSGATLRCVVVG